MNLFTDIISVAVTRAPCSQLRSVSSLSMAKVVYSSASTMLSSEDGERDRVSVMIDDFKQQDAKYSSESAVTSPTG